MTIGSPHIYREKGARAGVPSSVVEAAIAQAGATRFGAAPVLTLRHLCAQAEIDYRYVRRVVARQVDPYRTFRMKKRKGGYRTICIPEPQLLHLQRWILTNILVNAPIHENSYAFQRRSSIVCCAKQHVGCRWLIKLDVQQFFESISERDVFHVFHAFGYQPLVCFELARVSTRMIPRKPSRRNRRWLSHSDPYRRIGSYSSHWMGHLPQGSPTSPSLGNARCYELDRELVREAVKHGLVYTRYADDLIFSTSRLNFNRADALNLVRVVGDRLRATGLRPNASKAVIVPPGARKIVLGLGVDTDIPRLTRPFRNRVERHVRCIEKFGLVLHARHNRCESVVGMLNHVRGLIAFSHMVEPDFADPLFGRLDLAVSQ